MDNDNTTTASTVWTRNNEAALVCTLKAAKNDGKWDDNNPKPVAWTLCVIALRNSEVISGGAAKTSKAIRSRWQRIRTHHVFFSISMCLQLKQEYIILKTMRDLSGWGWDNVKKAPITSDEIWNAYIDVRPSYLAQL